MKKSICILCSRIIFAALIIFSLSSQDRVFAAESFRDFVWPFIQDGSLSFDSPDDFANNSKETSFKFQAADARWAKIKELYLNSLPKNLKNSKWSIVQLATPYRMHKFSSAPEHFNDSIIRLTADPKINVLFRPIEVTTGCDSGCTPVTFHLKYDAETKKLLEILQEKDFPLRKAYHDKLTETDVAKLFEIARTLPQALKNVESPSALTDPDSGFPRQTWTFGQSILVPKAAYTSYRVFEAALKTQEYFNSSMNEETYGARVRMEQDWIADYLNLEDPKLAAEFFKSSLSKLDSKESSLSIANLQARALPYLALWLFKDTKDSSALESVLAHPLYQSAQRNSRCRMLKALVHFEKGRAWLKTQFASDRQELRCSEASDKILEFLARAFDEKDPKDLARLARKLGVDKLRTQMSSGDPELEKLLLSKVFIFSDRSERAKILANWKIRYPLADTRFLEGAADTEKESTYAASLKEEETLYRQGLSRRLNFFPRKKLELLTLLSTKNSKTVSFQAAKSHKRILVFFASWCPHCQKFAAQVTSSPSFKEISKKIQFIEIYKPGEFEVREFCKIGKMPDGICAEILRFPVSGKQFSRFADAFAFSGVPRIFIMDEDGGIAADHFDLEARVGQDVVRDLLWIAEESSTSNNALRAP